MIAETANLTTARNVVKEAEGQVAGRFEIKGPTNFGLSSGLDKLKLVGPPGDRSATVCHPTNREAQFMMIWREQTRTGECLIRRLSGKPLRTPAFELPARKGVEGGAE